MKPSPYNSTHTIDFDSLQENFQGEKGPILKSFTESILDEHLSILCVAYKNDNWTLMRYKADHLKKYSK